MGQTDSQHGLWLCLSLDFRFAAFLAVAMTLGNETAQLIHLIIIMTFLEILFNTKRMGMAQYQTKQQSCK